MDLVKFNPTNGETIYIRRLRRGQTQPQAATAFGVSVDTYGAWEKETLENCPRIQVQPIKPREACILLRRRAKKTQHQIAKEIGISRAMVVKAERGLAPLTRLATYWGIR